jgi:hypothetical protein
LYSTSTLKVTLSPTRNGASVPGEIEAIRTLSGDAPGAGLSAGFWCCPQPAVETANANMIAQIRTWFMCPPANKSVLPANVRLQPRRLRIALAAVGCMQC